MPSTELDIVEHYDQMNKVVEEHLKGSTPKQIQTKFGMTRAQVLDFIDEYKKIIHNDPNVHNRAREALAGADQHYNLIIATAWETVEQADQNQQYAVKTQALKLVADTEAKRIDMLNKAGALENTELAEQVVETERKQKILMEILRDVVYDCDHCKVKVAERLAQISNQVEVIRVD